MLKTKRIAETPAFQEFHAYKSKKVSTEGPKSSAEANVMARLYKSNPVNNVYPDIMTGIRDLLGLKDAPAGKKDGKGKEKGDAKAAKEGSAKSKSKSPPKAAQDDISGEESGEEEADSALGAKLPLSKKGGDNDDDQEMSDAGSDDFAQFDSRLAPDSGDEDDEEEEQSGSEDGSDGGIDLSASKLPSDMSISRSPSPDSPPAKKQKAQKAAAAAPITSTTFLPSLSMGGYFSGSESEAEDAEDAAPRRKNRMGQQARRALWEKKFGSGANHVKNQKDKGRNNRDSGWDARRGATDGRDGPRGRRGQGRGGAMGATGANALPRQGDRSQTGGGPAKKPDDNKPLHPSWEAAKKAKEQKAASFQGKKVVFD